jgi:N-acetylglucosaminyl-diphospho-decaprenol L-rhamnosyltransferase
MADVDVVIVNYKSAAHTVKCVEAVSSVARVDSVSAKIIVVNNGDDDTSLEANISSAGQIAFIDNQANLGFGAASNIGAQHGESPFILFLNPDASLHPDVLRLCLAFMKDPENSSVGIVGPEILNAKGQLVPSCSRLPTRLDLIFRSLGLHVILGGATGYPYLSLADHGSSRYVGQVMGAALMIRRPLYDAVQGFDESFFLYYEDVDLCARAFAKGGRCYYLKEAHVTHIGRVSSSQDSGFSLALHMRSRHTYARLHFGLAAQATLVLVCVLIEFPARLLQAMLGRGAMSVRGVLRTYKLLALNYFSGTALPTPGAGIQSPP